MRFFAYFFLIFCIIPIAKAPYGGETVQVVSIPECSDLNVSVSGSLRIDPGEYELIGCEEQAENSWKCPCHDNYTLFLKTLPNTVNSYNVTAVFSSVADEDRDGVPDEQDVCPGSAGTDVDAGGCTAHQFCSSVQILPRRGRFFSIIRCYASDWKDNDISFLAGDCRVIRNQCIASWRPN